MAFPKVEPKYDKGERGEAQVRGDKKTVKFRFEETKNVHTFKRTRDTSKLRPGRWFIQLSGDESEVFGFHPWSGNFKGKVAEFSHKEDEAPVARLKDVDFNNKEGKHIKYSYYYFIVLLEILEPKKYAGILVPHRLNYNFLEAKNDNDESIVGLMSKGARTKDLAEFLRITGADKGAEMEWEDNILPALEKRILHSDKSFNFIIKQGWIDTLYEADEPESSDDELSWDEE